MKTKTTRRALLMSILSLIACVSMLIGTTFAWFTDSVTSTGNKIVAGNLKVDLLMADENGEYASIANKDAAIFGKGSLAQDNAQETLWEPGKTQIVYLAVANKGSLDLKYSIALDVVDGGLIGSLEYAIIDGADATTNKITATSWEEVKAIANVQTGDVAAGTAVAAPNGAIKAGENAVDYFALAVHMKEEAGNEYKDKDITIDVTVIATQLASEEDSFDNKYDASAPNFLPAGVSEEDFGTNVAYVNGVFYPDLKKALAAIHNNGAEENVLYLKPGADLGTVTHAHVCSNLTVYGNGAFISGGEQDFEIGFPAAGGISCAGIKDDLTLNVYDLNGAAVWGSVTATLPYDINVNFVGCEDMTKVMLLKSGDAPSYNLNISIDDCTFTGTDFYRDSAIYCQNLGTLNISNTTFKDYAVGINQNNKDGIENYTLTDCVFVDCATASNVTTQTSYAAPVRAVASVAGTVTNLTLTNCKFVYTGSETAINGDILTFQDGDAGTVNLTNN